MSRGIARSSGSLILILLMIIAASVNGQESGIIQATATVLPALTVTGMNDLRFEVVIPGVDKSVDKATVGFAGAFQLQGHNSAEVSLDFILPPSLLLDSTAAMPVDFSNTDASYDDGTGGGQGAPLGNIDPNGPFTLRLGTTGLLDLWLGGSVHPTITQTGGDYAADITLTAIYTGN